MIKRRVFSMFAIALLLGLGAAWMANGWIQARIQPAEAGDAATVVVAALEVPFGTKIESSHIRTAEWPVGSVPALSGFAVREKQRWIAMHRPEAAHDIERGVR